MMLRPAALPSAMFAILFSCGAARAQDAAAAPTTLDAIEVSASKRMTPLQKTPVAVSAISAETLDKERVMTVQDIAKLVPGLQATTQGDHGAVTMTLRGVGNDSAKTEYADPEVAIFVDGVYAPRAEAATSLLLDMESAEVLRGPQGTLWGRNSTVGAVNFQTAKPELGSRFGNAQISVGNYAAFGARAAVNLPVNDRFALRVALAQQQHDGYVDYQDPQGQLPSVASQQAAWAAAGGAATAFVPIDPGQYVAGGDRYSAQDQSAARVSALWQPSEAFSWTLSVEYFRDRGTPGANLMQTPRPGQAFWSMLADTAPLLDRHATSVRTRIDYDLDDRLRLSYIGGYSDYHGASTFDQDAGAQVPTSFATGATFQENRTNYSVYKNQSHELDLSSIGDNALDWIVGLYYGGEHNAIRFDIPQFNGTRYGTVAWQGSFIQPRQTVDSSAVFGQATWHLSDTLRLTAGARYTHDEKRNRGGRGWGWTYDPGVPQVPITPATVPGPDTGFAVSTYNDGTFKADKTTWLARIDGDLGARALWYASVSTGYKSGGLQDAGAPYKGETLTNYEVGTKLGFLGGNLTWNTALYFMDFKDFQLAAPITFPDGNHGLGFSNVGGSTRIAGLETELAARLGQDDRLTLIASFIPEKTLGTLRYAGSNDYAGLPACPPASNISACVDVSGNELPHAPDVSLTAIWEHDFHLGNGALLTPRLSGHYESGSWLSNFNFDAHDRQKAYARGDFDLRYQDAQGRWWASVYVQNVADGKVRTNLASRFVGADGGYLYTSQYLPPRTYELTVGTNF